MEKNKVIFLTSREALWHRDDYLERYVFFSVKNWGGTVKDAGELKNIKFKAVIEGSAKGPRKNSVKGRDKELE